MCYCTELSCHVTLLLLQEYLHDCTERDNIVILCMWPWCNSQGHSVTLNSDPRSSKVFVLSLWDFCSIQSKLGEDLIVQWGVIGCYPIWSNYPWGVANDMWMPQHRSASLNITQHHVLSKKSGPKPVKITTFLYLTLNLTWSYPKVTCYELS